MPIPSVPIDPPARLRFEATDDPRDTVESILELAMLANKDRGSSYGHPREHFSRTVGGINAVFREEIIRRVHAGEEPIQVNDWPFFMILDKIAREMGSQSKRDNLVDIAGYANTADMLR